ncbi:MAG: hypothetical protein OXB86_04610 [Bdellovibrionales bacterium]|nr:hypothetical protein [Bdellovibrionales bacterium]
MFFLLVDCIHTTDKVSQAEKSAYRDLAFFSPSVLSPTDNREMTLFYDMWASQFKEAIENYKSAIKQYKQVVWNFKKMSKYTDKKQDRLFRKHFKNAEIHLRAADTFLNKAQQLRTTKPPFGSQNAPQVPSTP